MRDKQTIRIDSACFNFLKIAADAVLSGWNADSQLRQPTTNDGTRNAISFQRFNQFAISLAFSEMCLESFLYDYAAHVFSDDFVRQHLDRMSFLSKCEAYPRLITGFPFDKSTNAWKGLRKLNSMRNTLLHWKSAAPALDPEVAFPRENKRQKEFDELPRDAENGFLAISLYAIKLAELHETARCPHPFLKPFSRQAIMLAEQIQQKLKGFR